MTKPMFLLFIPIMILQSCITSLQPLVTRNTAVTDSRLTGMWNSDDQDYTIQKVFESDIYKNYKESSMPFISVPPFKRDSILYSKSYLIHYVKNKIKYDLYGSMIQLNGEYFMNFNTADMNQDDTTGLENEVCPTCILQTYTIARIRFSNSNTIKLDFIDGDFLYKQVNAGRMKIKHETDDLYDTFLITASTYELQQFILKYGKDDRFFDKENSVTLIRKS